VFQPDHRCRLDARTDALELARGIDRACVGSPVGSPVGRAVGGAVAGRIGRTIRVTDTVRIGRTRRDGGTHRNTRAILTADGPTPTDRGAMEDELVDSGRFVRIDSRGSRTGLDRPVTVGFVDDDDQPGCLLVAATDPDASWAGNLLAHPACHVRVGDRSFDAVAEPLDSAEHARAIRGLILRYGTPAEGLGHGPSFRLRPVGEGES
jgi:deazaflavin-dependent oxidoreductase (nitroreductase family)